MIDWYIYYSSHYVVQNYAITFKNKLFIFSAADLPQCNAGDTKCLPEVITKIISEHPNGHPGLSIPPLEPLRINSIDIIQGADSPINIDLHFKNLDLNGISKAIITKVV